MAVCSLHLNGVKCICKILAQDSRVEVMLRTLLQEEVRPTTELVQSLIETHVTLDAKMAASKVSLFSGSAGLDPTDISEQSG